jgi:ribonuclease BN (tRNA processing enzyme)
VSLTLTVLGTDGSYPGPGGACSGYLVQAEGVNLVLDLGPGTLANLQRHIGLDAIDAVVLSHSHPDHWSDLTGLRTALKYGLDRAGLAVYGTRENRRLASMLATGLEPTFDWHDLSDGDRFSVGALDLSVSRTEHYVETLAVRVDDRSTGRSLAYSADTGPGWSFSALGDGVDLALCESTYPTDAEAAGVLHLSAGQAGAMAAAAGVGRLVLTHLWPGSDPEAHGRAATEQFGRPVEVAREGDRFEV